MDTELTFPPQAKITFQARRNTYGVTSCEVRFPSGTGDHEAIFNVELSDGQDDPGM